MEPGAFSVSLAVQDLEASRLFYEASFADVREVQKSLDRRGIEIATRADPDSVGPAHIVLSDPDGNVIMLDQHV